MGGFLAESESHFPVLSKSLKLPQLFCIISDSLQILFILLGLNEPFHKPADLNIASTDDVSTGVVPLNVPLLASFIAALVIALGSL